MLTVNLTADEINSIIALLYDKADLLHKTQKSDQALSLSALAGRLVARLDYADQNGE